jgi:hypothetical protein
LNTKTKPKTKNTKWYYPTERKTNTNIDNNKTSKHTSFFNSNKNGYRTEYLNIDTDLDLVLLLNNINCYNENVFIMPYGGYPAKVQGTWINL